MFGSRLETQVSHNDGWILTESLSRIWKRKEDEGDDVNDDVMSKHNVILVLQLTNYFVPKWVPQH